MKGSLGQIMQQAQQMQQRMQAVQDEIAQMEVTGESGAGMVKVTLNGKHEARAVQIDPSLFSEDRDLLEDLVAAAITDAARKVAAATADKMQSVTGGLNLPAGFNPFG